MKIQPQASAGTDQTICDSTVNLSGNNPSVGTGNWTRVLGGSTVIFPSSPISSVTGLSVGDNDFVWTITNGVCNPSIDTVRIQRDALPTRADAGRDTTICDTDFVLDGNNPTVGTGNWFLLFGAGIPASAADPNTNGSGMGVGVNQFQWTVSNGVCPSSSDVVNITRNDYPSTPIAGPDDTICTNNYLLFANFPSVGSGAWNRISGLGNLTSPSSPTCNVNGLGEGVNEFTWTISNGVCPVVSDTVVITRDSLPTIAYAGIDQTICDSMTTLNGNPPLVGTGIWTLVSGTGTPVSPSSDTTQVIGMTQGSNIFAWTISNGVCPPSSDQVIITQATPPTSVNAGANDTICAGTYILTGSFPAGGVGTWNTVTGSGSVSLPTTQSSPATGLSVGLNQFSWTISNGICPPIADTVDIYRDPVPTTANAGSNFSTCDTVITLSGNTANVGTGRWTLVSGSGTITNDALPNTTVTGLGAGANEFEWTITSGICAVSSDRVIVTRDTSPPLPNAGQDSTICASGYILSADVPLLGNGVWTVLSGGSTISVPTSPNSPVSGLSAGPNELVWTVTFGTCPSVADTVVITRDRLPTAASAGPDVTICSADDTLAGNTPSIGTGQWSLVSGPGSVTDSSSNTSPVSGLGVGANEFQWTISNGVCPSSSDRVVITRNEEPSVPNAGQGDTLCGPSYFLSADLPGVGSGQWIVVSGPAVIALPSAPSTPVNGLGPGVNQFSWTITSGVCPPVSDTVTIFREQLPTTAVAGNDTTICNTVDTLRGNTPVIGTGMWTLVSGSGTIVNPSSPTTAVTGLGIGANVFKWSISIGICPPSEDEVTITRDENPTQPNAGSDDTLCTSGYTLVGNLPAVGSGIWTQVGGAGTVQLPTSPASPVTNLGFGINSFEWKITNGVCPSLADTVNISRDVPPTIASAGLDQVICDSVVTLMGNIPTAGTGTWMQLSGTGAIQNPNMATTLVNSLGLGANEFRWTITNGVCPPSSENVILTRDAEPTPAFAGQDTTVCNTTYFLSGNAPLVGTGLWSLLSGQGTPVQPNSPTSPVSNLGVGVNGFIWVTSNGVCPSDTDTVYISRDENPTTANAGSDFDTCSSTVLLNGNAVMVGTGEWTVISGNGVFNFDTIPNPTVDSLNLGPNDFQWTITNGVCPPSVDVVRVTRDQVSTPPDAGEDSIICAPSYILVGNTPQIGFGLWERIPNIGGIQLANSPVTGVNGLLVGPNTFVWSTQNGVCPALSDTVVITRDEQPTTSFAGLDTTICASSVTLNADTPVVGTGVWVSGSGSGTITDTTASNTTVTGLGNGPNTFTWRITNGVCPVSEDDVVITRDPVPTTPFAGLDRSICDTFAILSGNNIIVGRGFWETLSGPGSLITPNLSVSTVVGLGVGDNSFIWATENGVCDTLRDTVTISVGAATRGVRDNDTICSGDTLIYNLQLNVDSLGGNQLPSSFRWVGDANPLVSGISTLPKFGDIINDRLAHNEPTPQTVVYRVNGTSDSLSCTGPEFVIEVIVDPTPPIPAFIDAPASVCRGANGVNLAVNAHPSYTFYDWTSDPAGLSFTGQGGAFIGLDFPNTAGPVEVKLLVRNQFWCASENSIVVNVTQDSAPPPCDIFLLQPGNVLFCPNPNYTTYQWGFDKKPSMQPCTLANQVFEQYFAGDSLDTLNRCYWLEVSQNGCATKNYYKRDSIFVTGIDPEVIADLEARDVILYPNPNQGSFNLYSKGGFPRDVSLQLFDLQGVNRKVLQYQASGQDPGLIQVNAPELSAGLYFIQMVDEEEGKVLFSSKLIIF